eukprot:4932229-Pleurochrysis_carterae.AAC.1
MLLRECVCSAPSVARRLGRRCALLVAWAVSSAATAEEEAATHEYLFHVGPSHGSLCLRTCALTAMTHESTCRTGSWAFVALTGGDNGGGNNGCSCAAERCCRPPCLPQAPAPVFLTRPLPPSPRLAATGSSAAGSTASASRASARTPTPSSAGSQAVAAPKPFSTMRHTLAVPQAFRILCRSWLRTARTLLQLSISASRACLRVADGLVSIGEAAGPTGLFLIGNALSKGPD